MAGEAVHKRRMDVSSGHTSPEDDKDFDHSVAGEEGEGRKLANRELPSHPFDTVS